MLALYPIYLKMGNFGVEYFYTSYEREDAIVVQEENGFIISLKCAVLIYAILVSTLALLIVRRNTLAIIRDWALIRLKKVTS